MHADRRGNLSRLGLAVGAMLSAGLLAACGGHQTPGGTPTPGSSGAASNGGASSGAAGGGDGTSGSAPVSYPNGADAYSKAAIQAWVTGDSTRLGQLNDPADTLFTTLSAGNYDKAFSLYECDGAAGSAICVFYNKVGDEAELRMRQELLGNAHAVVDGKFIPITFPTDLQAYGQEALDAWRGHNTAAVALLTGRSGDTAFKDVPEGQRTESWTFDHNEGAMGHTYYLWHNTKGDQIGISFANPAFVTPPPNRHGMIETVVFVPHP